MFNDNSLIPFQTQLHQSESENCYATPSFLAHGWLAGYALRVYSKIQSDRIRYESGLPRFRAQGEIILVGRQSPSMSYQSFRVGFLVGLVYWWPEPTLKIFNLSLSSKVGLKGPIALDFAVKGTGDFTGITSPQNGVSFSIYGLTTTQ